jgi:cytochrome c2
MIVRLGGLKLVALMLLAGGAVTACEKDQSDTTVIPQMTEADSGHGKALMQTYGCGSCHLVPGITGATGLVGPPLTQFARRVYVAGMLRNTPDNLMNWLNDPQAIVPGNAMPNLGVTPRDARDMAAYLYTMR